MTYLYLCTKAPTPLVRDRERQHQDESDRKPDREARARGGTEERDAAGHHDEGKVESRKAKQKAEHVRETPTVHAIVI